MAGSGVAGRSVRSVRRRLAAPAAALVLAAAAALLAGCDDGMSTVLVRNRTDQPLEVSRVPEGQLLARVNPGADAAFRVSAGVCEQWTLEAAAPDGRTARRQPPNCDGVRWTVRSRDLKAAAG